MAARRLTSLGDALQLAMEAPGARRVVVVDAVHLSHAAALQAFLDFERVRGRWELRNAARLASVVSLDGLLRALATGLLPRLLANPASAPTLLLVSRYARYVMASASAAGGTFAHAATAVCEYLIHCAEDAARRPMPLTARQMRDRAKQMQRRVVDLRSRQLSIADDDSDSDSDYGSSDEGMAALDDLHLHTLLQAVQEAADAPAAARRVFVDTVRASRSLALFGVVDFQSTACSWTAANIGRLRAATTVAGCFEALTFGLLRALLTDPTHRAALTILADFANYTRQKIGAVGGQYTEQAARVCDSIIAHGLVARRPLRVPGLLMRRRAEKISNAVSVFMSRDHSISIDTGSDTISDSDATETDTSSSSN